VPAKHGRQNHAKQILAVAKVALEQEHSPAALERSKGLNYKTHNGGAKKLYYCLMVQCFCLMPAGIVTATSLLWQLKKCYAYFFLLRFACTVPKGDLCDYW